MQIIYLGPARSVAAQLQRGRALASEEQIAEKLAGFLDDHYYLIRNLTLPGDKYDLDMVLVGPGGIWEFEILPFEKVMGSKELGWLHWDPLSQRLQPIPPELVPRTQAKAERLNRFLEKQGLTGLEINQANILATPEVPQSFTLPGLQVVFIEELQGFVTKAFEIFQPARPVPVGKVVQALTRPQAEKTRNRKAGRRRSALTSQQVYILGALGLGALFVLVVFLALVAYYYP